jgi:hypothetical protein
MLADGTPQCDRPSFKFFDSETRQEITTFPHKGIDWDESTLTLQPQNDDPVGPQKVLISTYHPSQEGLLEMVEILYFVHSETNQQRKL